MSRTNSYPGHWPISPRFRVSTGKTHPCADLKPGFVLAETGPGRGDWHPLDPNAAGWLAVAAGVLLWFEHGGRTLIGTIGPAELAGHKLIWPDGMTHVQRQKALGQLHGRGFRFRDGARPVVVSARTREGGGNSDSGASS